MSNYTATIRKRVGNFRPHSGNYEIVLRSADLGGVQIEVYATEMDYDAAEAFLQAAQSGKVTLEPVTDG